MQFNIEENKYRFINLLRKITRPGADIAALIYKLKNSDWFVAPASTIYHLNVPGGVVQHSLSVYDTLVKLVEVAYPEGNPFTEETLIIVGLLHDFDKMNKYEIYSRNVKKYSETGSKRDEEGRFDWAVEKSYKVKDAVDRFVYGHHGQNSEYMANSYIPLSVEESAAIVNHSGFDTTEYKAWDMTAIYNRYPLAGLLHTADFLSTYVLEPKNEQAN